MLFEREEMLCKENDESAPCTPDDWIEIGGYDDDPNDLWNDLD